MGGRRRGPLPPWVPDDLPPSPGVYQFEDAHGSPLYVGKSVNMRRRVRGYFHGGGPADPRLAEMLRLARGVSARPAGSDLEARLEEVERIARHRPPYNRALRNRARGWYIEIDWADPFPRLRVVRAPRRATARYFGPFRGRCLPAALAALTEKVCRLRTCAGPVRPDPRASPCLQHAIGLCTAPCAKEVGLGAYRTQVGEAAALLADGTRAESERRELVRRRERAFAADRAEEAAALGRRLAWLVDLEDHRRALELPRVDRSWLLVLPGAEEGSGVLVPVARGRVLPRRAVRWGDGWERAVEDACYEVRLAELRAEASFAPEEIAPSLIVTAWLEEGAPGGIALDLDRLDALEAVRRLPSGARGDHLSRPSSSSSASRQAAPAQVRRRSVHPAKCWRRAGSPVE